MSQRRGRRRDDRPLPVLAVPVAEAGLLGCRQGIVVAMDALVSRAEATFQSVPTSARSARRFVAEMLEAWTLASLSDLATLLVSELMSNVVLHAGTDAVVRLYRLSARVRVEVSDRSPRLPVRKRYSEDATTGRGLDLVDTLSAAWGVEPTSGGKVVWFELAEIAGNARSAAEPGMADDHAPPGGCKESFGARQEPARTAPSASSAPEGWGRQTSQQGRQRLEARR